MATLEPAKRPTPELFVQIANAFQQSAALKAAVELDVFTAIGEENTAVADIARRCDASERGIRILCDCLVVIGFLTKVGGKYGLTPDSAVFLDRRSPSFCGSAIRFICAPEMIDAFQKLPEAVRQGKTQMHTEGTTSPEHPVWVEFAQSMGPLQAIAAGSLAQFLNAGAGKKWKVLDIAAGHGFFGIEIARRNPNAEIVGLDWPNVLEVAKENARLSGIEDRYSTIAGSAFDVNLGTNYDLILLPNFLHHFDPTKIQKVLSKAHAALVPGGRAVAIDYVANEDRLTPPRIAAFALIMLGTTPAGDCYTFAEYRDMFRRAGFADVQLHSLPQDHRGVMLAAK